MKKIDWKQKKLQISFHILATATAALGWWGLLYPELAMTPDTYRVVYEETSETGDYIHGDVSMVEWDADQDIYRKILSADRSQLRFRSKLLMKLNTPGE